MLQATDCAVGDHASRPTDRMQDPSVDDCHTATSVHGFPTICLGSSLDKGTGWLGLSFNHDLCWAVQAELAARSTIS
jgi:hypothetical protein